MGFGEGSLLNQDNRDGFIKNERSVPSEEDWRSSKMPRTSGSESNAMLKLFRSEENGQNQNMLCFSSPTSELPFLSAKNGLDERNSQKQAFSCYDQTHGYVTEGLREPLLGTKCPFSPSQWIELEHQALVYKYLVANVPIPSNLLIALKKTVNPYGSFGWGAFHLGYPGNSDPELGRCRRTDGKKWRCSRDAVTDQKYCDRHINRGRHRSRKLVERQNGQVVSGLTAKEAAGAVSASAIAGSSASHSLGIMQNQHKGLQPGADDEPSADALVNWGQALQGHPVVSYGINPNSVDSNAQQKSSFFNSSRYKSELGFNNRETQVQNPLHLFIDNFPKQHQTEPNNISWSGDLKSDCTQLSMSFPKASSPPRECGFLSNRVPISWGCSMGGPLGEALNMTSSSGLNDPNSRHQLDSSPTGVLLKTTFGSHSNSSEGSSPRAENIFTGDGISTCYW